MRVLSKSSRSIGNDRHPTTDRPRRGSRKGVGCQADSPHDRSDRETLRRTAEENRRIPAARRPAADVIGRSLRFGTVFAFSPDSVVRFVFRRHAGE